MEVLIIMKGLLPVEGWHVLHLLLLALMLVEF